MSYTIAFVDSITTTPTVRLTLDGGDWSLQADGTDFSPPSLRRAIVQTLLADGALIPSAAYDNRVVTLRLYCTALTDDAAATAVQNLSRELDRPKNILMYQPGTSQPVFFRTLRADFTAIQWDPVAKFATVHIPAEPFAYGPKETLAPVTVQNDPALTNGCYFDVTSVKGDVETPLLVSLPGSSTTFATRPTSLLAARRRGTPASAPFVLQAESLTLGTDTTLQANDPAMSGSGSNFARVSFATDTTLTTRLSGTVGAAPGVDLRGTYRVLVRIRNTAAMDISMQLVWGPSFALVGNDEVTPPKQTGSFFNVGSWYIDLGLMQVPAGGDPVHDGYSGTELAVDPAPFQLKIRRASGTNTIDIDHLLFVPADDRMLLIRWPNIKAAAAADVAVVDGSHEQVVMLWTSGGTRIANSRPVELSGGFPMVSPGVANRVYLVRSIGIPGQSDSDAITGTTSITPSYYPRYLYVRPVTT